MAAAFCPEPTPWRERDRSDQDRRDDPYDRVITLRATNDIQPC